MEHSPALEQPLASPHFNQLQPIQSQPEEQTESSSPPGRSRLTPATPGGSRHPNHPRHHLEFPYKENVITRRAREPRPAELSYQFAPESEDEVLPPPRVGSSATLRPPERPERAQIPYGAGAPAVSTTPPQVQREEAGWTNEEIVKQDRMDKLGVLLQEVFGLAEQENVVEELPCWLLRSESASVQGVANDSVLKGYMFLTRQHICFFAHMPEPDEVRRTVCLTNLKNQAIKSGPLWKKNSRTKLHTRFWVVLRNDVLSWYENSHVNTSFEHC